MTSICCESNLVQCVEVSSSEEVKIAEQRSVVSKILSAIKKTVVLKHNQRMDRMAFRTLLSLDDNLLKDIGVTRHDVNWANNLPLSVNAAEKLNEIARRK